MPLEAILRKIEPSARTKVSALGIEEQRVDVVFDLLSPPEVRTGLGDGFSVFLKVVEWRRADVVQVPLSALFRKDRAWFVFREADGLAVRTPVTLGRQNRIVAEVMDGLSVGDKVVTHPSDQVQEGVKIVNRAALE